MASNRIHIDLHRLEASLAAMAEIGAIEGGGVCRLALSETDRQARERLERYMGELGLSVSVDAIGNIVGVRAGREDLPPVMTGSHIDSVATGGRYDGTLGVLAGLEVVHSLNDAGVRTRRPIAVASFTNEEGARFAPDMMGSAVHQGSLDLDQALAMRDAGGDTAGECLREIGYAGEVPVPAPAPHAFVELHVEQGPVLEREGLTIGAVTGVQGISWTEYTITGVSNHAGTTPMSMRHDAGYGAAALACRAREIATELGGAQVATVGAITLEPNLVNVVARKAVMTVDLRNTDESVLQRAEALISEAVSRIACAESLQIEARSLARFEPVAFAASMVDRVESLAHELQLAVRRMPSGAGHDAQMFAPRCPTGMVFVPSQGGISHNVREFTGRSDLEAGANVLANLILELAEEP